MQNGIKKPSLFHFNIGNNYDWIKRYSLHCNNKIFLNTLLPGLDYRLLLNSFLTFSSSGHLNHLGWIDQNKWEYILSWLANNKNSCWFSYKFTLNFLTRHVLLSLDEAIILTLHLNNNCMIIMYFLSGYIVFILKCGFFIVLWPSSGLF